MHVRVITDLIKALVVVETAFGHVVHLGDTHCLFAISADQRGHLASLGGRKSWQDLLKRQPSQAYNCNPDTLVTSQLNRHVRLVAFAFLHMRQRNGLGQLLRWLARPARRHRLGSASRILGPGTVAGQTKHTGCYRTLSGIHEKFTTSAQTI